VIGTILVLNGNVFIQAGQAWFAGFEDGRKYPLKELE
jgi:hypothetical protein